jgi:hypothetical protein
MQALVPAAQLAGNGTVYSHCAPACVLLMLLQCLSVAALNTQAKSITWNNAVLPPGCLEVDSGEVAELTANVCMWESSFASCCSWSWQLLTCGAIAETRQCHTAVCCQQYLLLPSCS